MICPLICLLIITYTLLSVCDCLRINSLIELQKDSSSITIEWSIISPDNNHNLDVLTNKNDANSSDPSWIGFKIKYFTDKLQYTPILLKNILFRKFRLDNLKPHTEYKIQVSAYDDHENEGPASRLLSVKTFETGTLLVCDNEFVLSKVSTIDFNLGEVVCCIIFNSGFTTLT